jgi:hypothetical protein
MRRLAWQRRTERLGQHGIAVNPIRPLWASDTCRTWFVVMLDDEWPRRHLEGIVPQRMGEAETDIDAPAVFPAHPAGG